MHLDPVRALQSIQHIERATYTLYNYYTSNKAKLEIALILCMPRLCGGVILEHLRRSNAIQWQWVLCIREVRYRAAALCALLCVFNETGSTSSQ